MLMCAYNLARILTAKTNEQKIISIAQTAQANGQKIIGITQTAQTNKHEMFNELIQARPSKTKNEEKMNYTTAGESHGRALTAIVNDVPAGISISQRQINEDLARRQGGYGRGDRMNIEHDTVQILSGVRFGKTIGSPVSMLIENSDWQNWEGIMSVEGEKTFETPRETTPRPGHADLVGAMKTGSDDCRDILERASARESAARVAAAGVAREFLADLGVEVSSYVTSIGDVHMPEGNPMEDAPNYSPLDIELSAVRCPDVETSEKMQEAIDEAREAGESLGGTFRVVACGLVSGLGGYAQGSDRLTSRLSAALFSIPAIKGVEFGLGFEGVSRPGSKFHDPIKLIDGTFVRTSNNAGGLEGGMTNGMPLIAHVAMKPIPTLATPLRTVNLDTLDVSLASCERSDVCAVPAASVVAECEVAFVLASAYMEAFGNNNMDDIKENIHTYEKRLRLAAR